MAAGPRTWLILGAIAVIALPVAVWTVLVGVYGATGAVPKPSAAATAPPKQAGQLFVASAFGDEVQAIDLASGVTTARIKVGKLPHRLVLGPNGHLYLTQTGVQAVAELDPRSHKLLGSRIVGEIPPHPGADMAKVRKAASCGECHPGRALGGFPTALGFTPAGQLWVTELEARELALLDRATLETREVVKVEHADTTAPSNVVFQPQGREAYVLARRFEPDSHVRPSASPFEHDPAPGVSWLTAYSADLKTPRWRLELPDAGAYNAVFAGGELYIACRGSNHVLVVDTARRKVVRRYTTAENPTGLALLGPDTLAVSATGAKPGAVQLLDRKTGVPSHTVTVGDRPGELAVSPLDGHLFVACGGSNEVLELDGERVVRRFPTGAAPVGLVVVP